MIKEHPDHHDAELVLKLYDLRREAVMREARSTIVLKFWPKTYEEVKAVLSPEHPHNAYYRQVTSYWEMADSFAKYGVVHPDFLIENAGEGMFLFAKMQPFLEQIRKDYSPAAYSNTEWLANNSRVAKERLAMMRQRVEARMKNS